MSQYKKIGEEFVDVILWYIRKNLSEEKILGRKINEDNSFSIYIHERSFLIIIDYTEVVSTKIRYIEDILFTKK